MKCVRPPFVIYLTIFPVGNFLQCIYCEILGKNRFLAYAYFFLVITKPACVVKVKEYSTENYAP